MAEPWPVATPRDEMLARVASAGRRRLLWRHVAIAAAVGAVFAAAAAGVGVGRSGGIDLVAESTSLRSTSVDAAAQFSRCPGGDAIGELHRDDRVFLTGRDGEAAWVELRSPSGAGDRVWIQAALVAPDEDVADLPVRDCRAAGEQLALPGETTTAVPPTTAPEETATTTTVPGQTTTTKASGPTTTTTQAPATTTPTTAPDTTPPSVSKFSNGGVDSIMERDPGYCGGETAPVSAIVDDASGITHVWLHWSYTDKHGQVVSGSKPMTLNAGRYRADLGAFTVSAPVVGTTITWSVRARDASDNEATVTAPSAELVELTQCLG